MDVITWYDFHFLLLIPKDVSTDFFFHLLYNSSNCIQQRPEWEVQLKSRLKRLIFEVNKRANIDFRCLFSAVIYLYKASPHICLNESNYLGYFCAAAMLSSKFHEDMYIHNSVWYVSYWRK